jgi:hypothetical protein
LICKSLSKRIIDLQIGVAPLIFYLYLSVLLLGQLLEHGSNYFLLFTRRQEENPLDLNNLPEEYGKQAVESSATTATSSVDTAASKEHNIDIV